jgi:hypothetical protein
MHSFHDNEIISYEVDFQKSKLMLHTIGGHRDSVTTTIEFVDVLTHMFETQLQGSIILDIRMLEISQFIEHYKELLDKRKNYGWPMHFETLEDLLERLKIGKYNYFVISASYGLNGWIVAKEYNISSM